MKKFLLAGLCAATIVGSVSNTMRADNLENCICDGLRAFAVMPKHIIESDFFIKGLGITVAGALACTALTAGSIALLNSWMKVRNAKNFLEGTSGHSQEIILQIINEAGSDVQKATTLVLNHFNGEDFFYDNRQKYHTLQAVDGLDSLCSKLDGMESELRGVLSCFWALQSTTNKVRDYISKIAEIRTFVKAIIANIKQSGHYKTQLAQKKAQDRQKLEYDVIMEKARSTRKVVDYQGQIPANIVSN